MRRTTRLRYFPAACLSVTMAAATSGWLLYLYGSVTLAMTAGACVAIVVAACAACLARGPGGVSKARDGARCHTLGVAAHLTKPAKQTDLLEAITAALNGSAPGEPDGPDKRRSRGDAVDLAAALRQANGDEKLLREMAELFIELAPQSLAEIHRHLDAGDAQVLACAAHTLKGSVSNFAAEAAFAAALNVEIAARSGDLASATKALTLLEDEITDVLAVLESVAMEAQTCES